MKGMSALFIALVVIGMVCAMGSGAVADISLGFIYCDSCDSICVFYGDTCSSDTNPDHCNHCMCKGEPLSCVGY